VLARGCPEHPGTLLLGAVYTGAVNFSDPGNMVQELPLLILLVLVTSTSSSKIPAMTMSIFSDCPAAMAAEWAGMITAAIFGRSKVRRHSFMSSTPSPPRITRAAERYLEQYGDSLVMNTYLKVTILMLARKCVSASRS